MEVKYGNSKTKEKTTQTKKMIHGLAPYIAMLLMIRYGKGLPVVRACLFLILIDSISFWHNTYLVIDNPWVYVVFSFVSLLFARLSLNSSNVSIISYLLFSIAYFLLGIEDKMNRNGIMDESFHIIMYGLTAFLVFSVTHDRMYDIKLRANSAMP